MTIVLDAVTMSPRAGISDFSEAESAYYDAADDKLAVLSGNRLTSLADGQKYLRSTVAVE